MSETQAVVEVGLSKKPGKVVVIFGPPGSGKSSSYVPNKRLKIKGLNPEKTFIIEPIDTKVLPLPNQEKYYPTFVDPTTTPKGRLLYTKDVEMIMKTVRYVTKKRLDIRNLVIEDASILSTGQAMDRASEKGWDKYSDIARQIWQIVSAGNPRPDLTVFLIFHSDKNESGFTKIKLAGKAIENNLGGIEALYSMIMEADAEETANGPECFFWTRRAQSIARAPEGMFDAKIPNDLGYVLDKIKEYEEREDDSNYEYEG